MRTIKITINELSIKADLNDSVTADKLWAVMPIKGVVKRWGREIYFDLPMKDDRSKEARESLVIGEIAFWPEGSAFCIFWGQTPASNNDSDIRAINPVNPLGRLRIIPIPDLDAVNPGDTIVLERLDSNDA
tara:strand:- start:1536 stop:1928 length:393 start_codon:yes stop_codon:yes gene_type:complete